MTLVYQTGINLPPNSLTVPSEAVRGLRGFLGEWKLFVSDPEPMSVTAFKLCKDTLTKAAGEVNGGKQFTVYQAGLLMKWLLEQESVGAEKIEAKGLPSMFPSFPLAGPKPTLGLNSPQMER